MVCFWTKWLLTHGPGRFLTYLRVERNVSTRLPRVVESSKDFRMRQVLFFTEYKNHLRDAKDPTVTSFQSTENPSPA